jgi:hypothetical protein
MVNINLSSLLNKNLGVFEGLNEETGYGESQFLPVL